MPEDYQFSDRLDFVMGLMAFVGVGVAVLIPFIFIVASIILKIPFLDSIIIGCQVGGCVLIGVSLGYFICRKET
jgi:hypothetical protein